MEHVIAMIRMLSNKSQAILGKMLKIAENFLRRTA
jgi:hypothetical protein